MLDSEQQRPDRRHETQDFPMTCAVCDGGPFYTEQAKWQHDCKGEFSVPTHGTQAAALLTGLLRAHADGIEWGQASTVVEYVPETMADSISGHHDTRTLTDRVRSACAHRDCVAFRERDGRTNEYRIDEAVREELRTILCTDDDD